MLVQNSAFAQSVNEIRFKLKKLVKISATIAPLKYNKKLAFSFTLDDGYRSAYTCAYPLLNGGRVSPPIPDEYKSDSGGDGELSAGLYYTNGCGERVPFRLAVALNAGIVYDRPDNRARLSWSEVEKLYDSGWDILNHGYHHLSKHGTDYNSEVLANIRFVRQKLGFTMTQFVVPGGDHDPGYEHDYEKDAFAAGSFTVASYVGAGPAINVGRPLKPTQLIYARDLLSSYKDSVSLSSVDWQLAKIDSMMQSPQPIWYNAFTHNAGNRNLWTISLLYPEFKYLMTSLYERYGQKGNDKLWMAPTQEVYEYLWMRDHAKITIEQHGKDVTIKVRVSKLPPSFRNTALTLIVDSKSKFYLVKSSLQSKISDNGNSAHNLINFSIR